jgi:hypothetical protein
MYFRDTVHLRSVQLCKSFDNKNPAMEEPLTMLEKLERAAPYNVFFNTIPDLPDTLGHPDNVNFADLLCPSLGQLKCSLQLNFIINPAWLMDQYNARALG